jgi:hypothetical protein
LTVVEKIKNSPNLQFNLTNQPTFPILDNFLGGVVHLAQDRGQWQALLITAINL